jgi:hypothetical protein
LWAWWLHIVGVTARATPATLLARCLSRRGVRSLPVLDRQWRCLWRSSSYRPARSVLISSEAWIQTWSTRAGVGRRHAARSFKLAKMHAWTRMETCTRTRNPSQALLRASRAST